MSALASDDRGANFASRPGWTLEKFDRVVARNQVLDGKQPARTHTRGSTTGFWRVSPYDHAAMHDAMRFDHAIDGTSR